MLVRRIGNFEHARSVFRFVGRLMIGECVDDCRQVFLRSQKSAFRKDGVSETARGIKVLRLIFGI